LIDNNSNSVKPEVRSIYLGFSISGLTIPFSFWLKLLLILVFAIAVIFDVFYFMAKYLTAITIAFVAWLGHRLIKDINNLFQKELKTCPHWAEQIKRAAKICRYCHRDVADVEIENKTPRGLFK
jgi:hypothetical protein